MARYRTTKTNFTAGEVSQVLLGRGDLTAYENGAARLRNVCVRPTGALHRRPGLRFIATALGPGRLVPFEFNVEQVYLLVFTDRKIEVFESGSRLAEIDTDWSESQVTQINWTQSADTLLVTHPSTPPKQITREADGTWRIQDWTFFAEDNGRIEAPHYKFAPLDTTLTRSGTVAPVILTASTHVFSPAHVNTRFRFEDREVVITDVVGAGGTQVGGFYDKAAVAPVDSLAATATEAKDWTEQAFSAVRGWPVAVTFHQDRLVIGGSRDLPNRLWLSRSSDLFNFDQGEGLDDEAIEFALLSDQVNAIRAVFSGRHLQVFTSGAEWQVTGDPLTPTNIQLNRQTRIGSPIDRSVPPKDVDGATIFVPRNGKQVREFLFSDVEQAYQASDLALLSPHLVNTPLDMDYDQATRLLHVVMRDGALATLTIYRAEQVTAWTLQETAGEFKSVGVVGDDIYVLVRRGPAYCIEVFDERLGVDSGRLTSSPTPMLTWPVDPHLEGSIVKVIADGMLRQDALVISGQIVLDEAALMVQVGLGFTHQIEPLPLNVSRTGTASGARRFRPISVTFRLHETFTLSLDLGDGIRDVPFRVFGGPVLDMGPKPFTGDRTIRLVGWRRDPITTSWRIEQDSPLPFSLLSVTSEYSING